MKVSSLNRGTPTGCDNPAQGNALGINRDVLPSSEGAGLRSRSRARSRSSDVMPRPEGAGLSHPFGVLIIGLLALFLASSLQAEDKKVSFYKEVVPIFKRSCNGCHHPGKLKGELDLTTYTAFKKGGKHGAPFKSGDPKDSIIIEEISGKEPSMP